MKRYADIIKTFKNHAPQITACVLMVALVFFTVIHPALAQNAVNKTTSNAGSGIISSILGFLNPVDLVNSIIAYVINILLGLMGFLLSVAAAILNVSLSISLIITKRFGEFRSGFHL